MESCRNQELKIRKIQVSIRNQIPDPSMDGFRNIPQLQTLNLAIGPLVFLPKPSTLKALKAKRILPYPELNSKPRPSHSVKLNHSVHLPTPSHIQANQL